MIDEFKLIERIRASVPRRLRGKSDWTDDAAVLPPLKKGRERLVSSDVIVQGVDFRIPGLSPENIGRKALAVNLSDLAAMGAEPAAFLVTLGIPSRFKASWVLRFYQGMMKLASQYRLPCVGGDLSSASRFFASVTILGDVQKGRVLSRSGAKPGNLIAVTGKLGGSISGHHYGFRPRIRESLYLSQHFKVSSMIDVSDGLVQDLTHLAAASGVSCSLDLDKIPVSKEALKLSRGSRGKALKRACCDGEDFELLFTVSAAQKEELCKKWKRRFPDVPLHFIGKAVVRGKKRIRYYLSGKETAGFSAASGYRHFAK